MKRIDLGRDATVLNAVVTLAWLLVLSSGLARADQIQMQNGDQYFGKVLSLNSSTLVIESDVLGTLRLPRGKVALISLGPATEPTRSPSLSATNPPLHAPALTVSNGLPDFSAAMRQLGSNSNLIQQVQTQFLNDAGPEATA